MADTPANIDEAVRVLRAGGLVAFPTETVYGLGADAGNDEALRRLYRVKGRPADHPVIVHIAAATPLHEYATDVPEVAHTLGATFWPGPLTLVLRKRSDRISGLATGGRPTVGLRVPDDPVARALLDAFAGAVAAPSANRFGRVSPTTAAHVRADLGDDVDVVLDGGPSRVGVESTIVDATSEPLTILRIGAVSASALARVAGAPLAHRNQGEVAAPGTLASHYAPDARVEVIDAESVPARVASLLDAGLRVGLLTMAPVPLLADEPFAEAVVVLEPPSDIDEYARVLYARFREADALGLDVVVAVPPPGEGIGAAICDRLHRASANSAHRQR